MMYSFCLLCFYISEQLISAHDSILYEQYEEKSYGPSWHLPAQSYNRNTRRRCEICSKLTIKTPEQRIWRRSGIFTVNFEHISHLVLVFLLLTLNM